jgi:hypothetical protein
MGRPPPASTAALFGTYAGNIAQNAVATSEPTIPVLTIYRVI